MTSKDVAAAHHFERLEASYREVGDRTWLGTDFAVSNLETSRNLFTPRSLAAGRPVPKDLEVFALLSGLAFDSDFTDRLVAVQWQITAILGECLHYWVAPGNFGVEYCVFKWPTDFWNPQWLVLVQEALARLRQPAFRFSIRGIQINPDGCVIAKGFDEPAVFAEIRQQLRADIPFLPVKQSSWAHVPLGRILVPPGPERFAQLARLARSLSVLTVAVTQIDTMKLVHETRWYMESRTVLAEYALARAVHE